MPQETESNPSLTGSITVDEKHIERMIRKIGPAGYNQCTPENLARRLSSSAGSLQINPAYIKGILENLEASGRVYRISAHVGECFSLKPSYYQAVVLF